MTAWQNSSTHSSPTGSQRKVALVTGSTSGIGLGIARALAAAGADIYLHGLGDPSSIKEVIAQLKGETGARIVHGGQDLSRAEAALEMVADAREQLGEIDILVNNAGIQHVAPVEDFPIEKWNMVLAINLTSAFAATQSVLPSMKARRFGRILNIASAHGLVASAHKSAYVASKHGLLGLTKVTALETARDGITCNAICPGWVKTPLVEKQIQAKAESLGISINEATAQLLGEKQPSQRFVTPDEIGQMAVFLSSSAASGMTGSIVSMDGGWTAQ
ncbi:MAG: 3-hydroxybutyrate dehydrogenase [Bdellovibrionaceae bacterium]|nr:3-hydroxybutyrate dehydrogenase [Pseudobdellovibrionaceae bacterium]